MRLGAFFARGMRTMKLCSSDARSRRHPSPIRSWVPFSAQPEGEA
jgi:hypothetical protein